MEIHYLQHVPYEGLGFIEDWARRQGHTLTNTQLFKTEDLPQPEKIDALIVMGGPMGIAEKKNYPWLEIEKKFIERCIAEKIKVLGICLGAQLIADILEAKVFTMPEKEIGWFPVEWTNNARSHPLLDFLPSKQTVLHWHGDMFQIPDGALNLATSTYCKNQGFLKDDHILGLQFHMEMTQKGLNYLINNSPKELFSTTDHNIQNPRTMLNGSHFSENHRIMEQLLNKFMTS